MALGELTADGPAVLVLAGLRGADEARTVVLRELAEELPAGVRLAVVSRRRSRLGEQAEAMRVADWLRDPGGGCFAALGVPCGRRDADAGVFVIDREGVLRLAYRTSSTEERIRLHSCCRGCAGWRWLSPSFGCCGRSWARRSAVRPGSDRPDARYTEGSRGYSSVGRAPGSHPGGQRFESGAAHAPEKRLVMRGKTGRRGWWWVNASERAASNRLDAARSR